MSKGVKKTISIEKNNNKVIKKINNIPQIGEVNTKPLFIADHKVNGNKILLDIIYVEKLEKEI